MGTKTGELRETLIEAIYEVRSGKMRPEQAKAIAMLAGQVNLSLQVEINVLREKIALEKKMGDTLLGEATRVETPVIEPLQPVARLVKGKAQSGSV